MTYSSHSQKDITVVFFFSFFLKKNRRRLAVKVSILGSCAELGHDYLGCHDAHSEVHLRGESLIMEYSTSDHQWSCFHITII